MTTTGRIQVLRASERPATTWLNGGGVTREVAGFPAGAGLNDFDWRVSLADVASAGPFSPFPGIDRVITLVEGTGMALTVDGVEQVVDAPFRPFAFPGDATTDCRLLGGPVVDFNVMTRRGRIEAAVDLITEPGAVQLPPAATLLLVCLAGSVTLDATALTRYDAALLDTPGTHALRPDGVTAAVTFRTATAS
ncbi:MULTISPECIES: HutD/Ves family protein [Kitasatospora]|uniref:HutD family protein n=1 Tax=Kitasatospora cathayae TaxID=3004092 RepID=A0ABY7PZN9_9ACTN|nr:HutD family protein [Kitasatospora sp. HUAS 3-15]WBP85719.1 HutD family protein [Kitasatospora sp. HUAS 3-15]